jgi:2-amino-4-hydroxy-6-hydroxymethyldihydropteridine diphosphokinase
MSIAYIGLGSNLANPARQIKQAVSQLRALPDTQVLAVSPLYHSKPVGPILQQPDFINAAVKLITPLEPLALLDQLLRIEKSMGRKRLLDKGPRIIDLDLLLYDHLTLQHARLALPHPAISERAFVIMPLLAIDPALCLPDGQPLRAIALDTIDVVQCCE